jgi:hypothetical protein
MSTLLDPIPAAVPLASYAGFFAGLATGAVPTVSLRKPR